MPMIASRICCLPGTGGRSAGSARNRCWSRSCNHLPIAANFAAGNYWESAHGHDARAAVAQSPCRAAVRMGGTGPFSGGVAQNILPWNWFANFAQSRFSWFTVNLGRSSAPEVEADILENVGSYGRQLGRISDVLEVLVDRLPRESLNETECAAVEDFSAQMREIKRIKEKRR